MTTRTCAHVRADGTLCGSPALKAAEFCYFHHAQSERRLRIQACKNFTEPFQLPLLEDANAVQIAIMDVANAFLADRIDHKKTSLILYALQTAATNARKVSFEPLFPTFKTEYDSSDYGDHDNLWAEQAAAEEEEGGTEPEPAEPGGTPEVTDLPKRKPAASADAPANREGGKSA